MGLWVGKWEGMVEDDTTTYLRFYDEAGNLVLLPEEAEHQKAEAERQRAEGLAERLRALGEDVKS